MTPAKVLGKVREALEWAQRGLDPDGNLREALALLDGLEATAGWIPLCQAESEEADFNTWQEWETDLPALLLTVKGEG